MLPMVAEAQCLCGAIPVRVTVTQLSLFIGVGYGAAERKTVDLCAGCWTVRVVEVAATNPRNV